MRGHARRVALLQLIAFLTLTGLLTFVIASQIARLDFGASYTVTATFTDVSGLLAGDRVKIAGTPVGQVGSIKVREGKAVVTLRIGTAHQVPSDSEAAIRWRDAVSQRVVYLLPGTSPTMLRDGDRIARTHAVVDIGDLITRLEPLTRSLDPDRVNQILTSIYLAMDGNRDNISRLLTNVDRLAETLATRRQTLQAILKDYAKVTGIISKRDDQIAKATDDLVTLSRAFVDNRELINEAIDQLSTMLRTTDKVVGRNADQLSGVLDELAFVMNGTQRNLAPLVGLTKAAGPKLQHLFDLFNDGKFVIGAVPCLTLAPGPCPYPMKLVKIPGQASGRSLGDLVVGGN